MLCGFHPFFEEDQNETKDKILKGRFDFPSPYWDNISEEAKDLIKKLLNLDPEKRLSAVEILQHSWLNTQNSRDKLPFSADLYNKTKQTNKLVKNLR
jgi:serine/threonine protein kinase